MGANDRVRLGFIGVANRGGQLMSAFMKHEDAEIAALCDVSKSTLDKANARLILKELVKKYPDSNEGKIARQKLEELQ